MDLWTEQVDSPFGFQVSNALKYDDSSEITIQLKSQSEVTSSDRIWSHRKYQRQSIDIITLSLQLFNDRDRRAAASQLFVAFLSYW